MMLNRPNLVSCLYVALAVALLVWQRVGMNHVLVLVPSKNAGVYLTTDNSEGGKSVARLDVAEGVAELDCTTRPSSVFAYCGFMVPLKGSDEQGIDLTRYDRLILSLSFTSGVRDTVLLYLHNDETRDGIRRTRVNMHPINPRPGLATYDLALSNFFIPSWWLLYFAQDQSDGYVNLTNVVGLQLTTGDNRAPKVTQLALGEVRLTGKWISAGSLYFYLLMGGLCILFARALGGLAQYRQKYKQSRARAAELGRLNDFLSVERDKFESMSKTDDLTACLNRAGAQDLLQRFVTVPQGAGPRAALILLDIDHFKAINDNHGHDAGDRVLVQLTGYVRQHIRQQDAFIRWGGEEFAIICPHTSGEQAAALAEHLRAGIAAATFALPEPLTCSFGVAELFDTDIEAWFKRADTALYRAKHQGRDRVALIDSGR